MRDYLVSFALAFSFNLAATAVTMYLLTRGFIEANSLTSFPFNLLVLTVGYLCITLLSRIAHPWVSKIAFILIPLVLFVDLLHDVTLIL